MVTCPDRRLDSRRRQGDHGPMPRKRAGAQFGPHDAVEQGPLTCLACHGSGSLSRPQLEGDRSGRFDGEAIIPKCPECSGTGKVNPDGS